jgi:hypothetical protein
MGETFTGGEPAAKAGTTPAGVPLQRTLFGIPAPAVGASPARAATPTPPAPTQPAAHTAGVMKAPEATNSRGGAVGAQRTLMGVVPEEVARVIDAARAAMAAPKPRADNERRATPAPAAPRPTPSAAGAFQPVLSATTVLGEAAPGPIRAAAPATLRQESPSNTPQAWEDSLPGGASPRAASSGPEASVDMTTPSHVDAAQGPAPLAHARTHLGVAIPGIAPLSPGRGKGNRAPAAPSALEGTRLLPPEAALSSLDLRARATTPRSAIILLGSGLLLLVAAGAFALFWRGPAPLTAVVSSDAAGKDRIDMLCEDCPDGTLISLAGAKTEMRGHMAYLTPAQALPLGTHTLDIGIRRPDSSSIQSSKLSLPPIEYRIRPDTSTLVGDQPRLTLKLEAVPGSRVEIAEKPVVLDAAGRGEISLDVGSHLLGAASEISSFEQAVGYVIVPPTGKEYRGELRVKIGVTPLVLDAPGSNTVTDMERFMLAGRTLKGSEIWVAGNTIAVDESGRFAQLMSIDALGETNVAIRATQPGLAPRFVSFRLQRVSDLQAEAQALRADALSLSQVADDIVGHVGSTLHVEGNIEEVRVDGHRTLLLVQAERDCGERSCLARLVYGGLRKLERGTHLKALGRLLGAVGAADKQNVPEIEVSLLL